jgi:hypothetical protein
MIWIKAVALVAWRLPDVNRGAFRMAPIKEMAQQARSCHPASGR